MTETRDERMRDILISFETGFLKFNQTVEKLSDLLDEAYTAGMAVGEEAAFLQGYSAARQEN